MTKTMLSLNDILVLKRDGKTENFNIDKIHKMVERACDGLSGVSVSDVEMQAHLSFQDGMTTIEIHRALTKAAADLISENSPNYQYVAGRLLSYDIRKSAWGGNSPVRLYDHIVAMINANYYTEELLTFYTEEEWDKLDTYIDHDRDLGMTHIGVSEYLTKYAVRNRALREIVPLETPQLTYILVAAILKHADVVASPDRNLKPVKEYYNMTSNGTINLATPVIGGVRTPTKQFSSCTLISCGDSLTSINETSAAIVKYAAKKAGIGIDASAIRAEGSSVGREKAVKHTGVVPYFRYFESALKSCSQGGIRGASATLHTMLWHHEIEDLLVLKNNKGTSDTRVRKLDYSIQINNYLYNRIVSNDSITLFSPHDVKDLYQAFFADQKKFKELYEKYEKDSSIRKKKVNARELFTKLIIERKETGRIYIFNVDNVNNHSTFNIPIKMSNLCQEITLPTVDMGTTKIEEIVIDNDFMANQLIELSKDNTVKNIAAMPSAVDGETILKVTRDVSEIALCTLSAINVGNIKSFDELENICKNIVRSLDNLLTYQNYMVVAAETSTMKYRPLGIGIINLAYFLAKNDLKYTDQKAYDLVNELMEYISFYCIKASIELAKERGRCPGFKDTKFAQGLLPIDHYNKNVDQIVKSKNKCDWEWLRKQLQQNGIRNSTLLALMPAESSSKISNATNGVEPIRALITTKSNKGNVSRQVVPEYSRLKNKYDLLWEMESMDGIIKMMAVIQKWTCQSISTNLSYNPAHYTNGEIPLSLMMTDIFKCNKYGVKTLYYHNTNDMRDSNVVEDAKPTEAEADPSKDADSCDACTI